MRPIILVSLLMFFTGFYASNAKAQDYKHAIKIKGFSPFGVSYKWLTGFEKGYEVSYHMMNNGRNVTGLRVFQTPLIPKKSDRWFVSYGYGTHMSYYWNYTVYNPFTPFDPPHHYDKNFMAVGLDGYVGVEYRILKHPFLLSIDFIPNFEFFGPKYFKVNNNNLTAGIAYVF
jgi:hypothetical protein